MCKIQVFLGLDYHKDAIQVCALNNQGDVVFNGSIATSIEGFDPPLGISARW